MSEITNPHVLNKDKYDHACKMCHPIDPHVAYEIPILPEGLTDVCVSCHQLLPLSCRRSVTREVTSILLEQIPNLVLKTTQEKLTCESCHLVHAERGKRINRIYSLFLKQVEKINPHRSGLFCTFCHEKEPITEEDPINIKYNGDRVKVCVQCHNNQRARADNHPVNRRPSEDKGIKVDERFPLFDGKVTCVTCHDIKTRCLGEEAKPKFLRGGPYKERVDACLVCHQKESYKAVNPHEQIDKNGRLIKDRCLYCHIIDQGSTLKD